MNKINLKRETKIKVLPLKSFVLIIFLNSWWRVIVSLIQIIFIREGINQNIGGIIKIPKVILIQFKENFKFVVGSNVEKRLAIIFNWLGF